VRRKGADMREAILRAACRAIVERGVDRVRMSDIAQAARVDQLEHRVAGGHPPRERLERMLLVYFDADPRVFEIWMLAREMTTRAIREPGLRDSHDDVYAKWTSSVADVIRAGQRSSDLPAAIDADRAAWRLTVTVEGLGTWLLTGMATRRQCRELVRESLARELT